MTHVQVHDSLRAQLIGWLTAQLSAFAIGEHPLVGVGVIHHIDVLSLMDSAHIMASVVQRNQASFDPPAAAGTKLERCSATRDHSQSVASDCPIVGPTGMHQAREEIDAAATFPVRDRPRGTSGPSAPIATAIPRASGRSRARTSGWTSPANARRPRSLGVAAGCSNASRYPARSARATARWGSRPGSPRASRCRPGRGRATPSERRPGGVAPARPRGGDLGPRSRGGKTAVQRTAPLHSSIMRSQLTSSRF